MSAPTLAGTPARTSAVIAGAEIVGKLATLVGLLVAARVLTRAEFGAYGYAMSFALLVATLPALGFNAVLVRQASRDHGSLPARLAENLVWRIALGLPILVTAGVLGALGRPSPQAAWALVLLLFGVALDLHDSAWRQAAAALQRQVAVYVALVAQRIVTAVIGVAALLLGFGLIGFAAAFAVGSVVGSIMTVTVCRRVLGIAPDLRGLDRAELRRAGRQSLVIGAHAIAAMALFRLDVVLLGLLRGDDEVAVYTVAYRLVETVTFLAWAVARTVYPVMTADPTPRRVGPALDEAVGLVAVPYVGFAVVALVLPNQVLGLLFGSTYATLAAPVLMSLALAPLAFGWAFLLGRALTALRLERFTLLASVIALTANVGLNVALMPRYGAIAAAATTSVAYALQLLVLRFVLRRQGLRARLVRACAAPLVAAGALAVLLLVAEPFGLTGALLGVAVPVGGAVYLGVWWTLARRLTPSQTVIAASLSPRARSVSLRLATPLPDDAPPARLPDAPTDRTRSTR